MTTIQISREVSSDAVTRIQALLENEAMHNPNWNGAEFNVELADYTCIPDDDSADACQLLNQINRAIDGE